MCQKDVHGISLGTRILKAKHTFSKKAGTTGNDLAFSPVFSLAATLPRGDFISNKAANSRTFNARARITSESNRR